MTTKKKGVLVSGHTGFIGSVLTHNKKFHAEFDLKYVRSAAEIREICRQWLRDSTFVNLAGRAVGHEDELWSSNVVLPRDLTRAFLNCGGENVVHASSGAVYGTPASDHGSLESDQHRFESYYGFTKSIGEAVIRGEAKQLSAGSLVVLRLPNVFGESQTKGVIYNMLKALKENRPVVINGNGTQRRDFLHVNDLIAIVREIVRSPPLSDTYNLSSPFSMSINDLVSLLKCESQSEIEFNDYDVVQSSLHLNYSKAQDRFGDFYNETLKYIESDFNWGADF